jgi:hypothetical protein
MKAWMTMAACLLLAACSRDGDRSDAGVRQTGFPGQVTAGGHTRGEEMAAAKKPADGSYAGGTPGIAGGAEGNTGGAKMGGTVQESGHGPSGTTAPPAAKSTPSGQ